MMWPYMTTNIFIEGISVAHQGHQLPIIAFNFIAFDT